MRAPEPDDLEFLYELENDPALWAVTGDAPGGPVSRHALREYLRQAATQSLAEAGQLRLIIQDESGRAVGTLDLFDLSARHGRAGVGVALLPGARRRGHARAALAWLLPYARQTLGLHQLYCTVAADNAPSLRLFRAAGFRRVGVRRQWLRRGTGWLDVVEMQRLL